MDTRRRISLDGDWKMAVVHHREYLGLETTPSDYDAVLALGAIDAVVPGNFELDLQRAGLIVDPFYGMNPIAMQAYEDAHVLYARRFEYAAEKGLAPTLVFEGLDTLADIYLNGTLIGSTDNMFITHRLAAQSLVNGTNELVLHFTPVDIGARGQDVSAGMFALEYEYGSLRIRKAPHMYGWDIMPRMLSAGIFRPAYVELRPEASITQAYLMTVSVDTRRSLAELELFFDLDLADEPLQGYRVCVEGKCGDSCFSAERRLWATAGKFRLRLEDAQPWWPRGYGQPNLYDVTVTLKKDGTAVDAWHFRTGLRTVKLVRTSTTDMDFSGQFHFEVNGQKVFLQGTNWVPLDAFHSRDRARIPRAMELALDIGVNAIRCWGGNVYEDPLFYELCDQNGIVVWQDFALACAVYPIDQAFCDVMRREAISVVRMLRQHPCIILWSGDNECDEFMMADGYGRDPNLNRVTREVLRDVALYEDPTRPYLPSSPYADENAWQLGPDRLPENHLWGPRDYFRGDYYAKSLCNFASEMGYHGCPSITSMQKFLSPDKLWPWQDNDEWIVHAASPQLEAEGPYVYRIELMAKQIKELFGYISDTLEDFVIASQISQAEAKKFFVELFRTGQGRRSGIIWWNLIDGWPQFSDAVVDYYYDKKLAYHYIRQSQQPFILACAQPKDWLLPLMAVNNAGETIDFRYTVEDAHTGAVLLAGSATSQPETSVEIGTLPYSHGEHRLYVMRWESPNHTGHNHYLAGNPPFDLDWYRGFLDR